MRWIAGGTGLAKLEQPRRGTAMAIVANWVFAEQDHGGVLVLPPRLQYIKCLESAGSVK